VTDLHYEDPDFEIVDDPNGQYTALLAEMPVNLEETDLPPTGEPDEKTGDHTDEDEDAEVLREN
jgi:hypothetical protein